MTYEFKCWSFILSKWHFNFNNVLHIDIKYTPLQLPFIWYLISTYRNHWIQIHFQPQTFSDYELGVGGKFFCCCFLAKPVSVSILNLECIANVDRRKKGTQCKRRKEIRKNAKKVMKKRSNGKERKKKEKINKEIKKNNFFYLILFRGFVFPIWLFFFVYSLCYCFGVSPQTSMAGLPPQYIWPRYSWTQYILVLTLCNCLLHVCYVYFLMQVINLYCDICKFDIEILQKCDICKCVLSPVLIEYCRGNILFCLI